MKYEIKHRYSGEVLFSMECDSFKVCVEAAVRARASLDGASLDGARLDGASLVCARLVGASLVGANLDGANLDGASLVCARLDGASLVCARLVGASLVGASLVGANLDGASLDGARLVGAKGADLPIKRTRILPEGSLIGWKKCRDGVLVKLRIPEDAKRSHAWGRKCRAEYADVLEVIGAEVGVSQHDGKTTYTVGARVTCDKWESDWTQECAGGIHFYITREEAEAH